MSFLVWPPEVNSSLMFTGAGSDSMLAAATAWDGVGAELNAAAQSFTSLTADLAGQAWQGAASATMLQTATRYAGYLGEATARAQASAAQALAAVSAFESAQAATVHPLAVAANRDSFVQLVSSNLLGQNAPAIAALEAEYEQMWAHDVAAMAGYHSAASAAVAALPSWTTVLQGLPGELSGALSATPAAGSGPLGEALGTLLPQPLVNLINAPTEFLFGTPLISTGPALTLGGQSTGTVPVTMYLGTEALVNATVGTGSPVPLLVDTGSTGLVIPFQKVGGVLGLFQLGLPTGAGVSGYSGGLNYAYLTYDARVNFGGGLATSPTPVDVELFAWPTSIQSALSNGFSFQSYFAADGAAGVLGVGPNAGGPGPSIATQALPGNLGQGVLINETATNPYIQFGPQPSATSPLGTPIAMLPGAPITKLDVTITTGSGNQNYSVLSEIDSGGVDGTFPISVATATPITVYAPATSTLPKQLLYSYDYGTTYYPTLAPGVVMNTGALIFLEHPIYIDYAGQGETVIYGTPPP